MIILAAGTLHVYGFLTTDQGVFDPTPYALATLVGVGCSSSASLSSRSSAGPAVSSWVRLRRLASSRTPCPTFV